MIIIRRWFSGILLLLALAACGAPGEEEASAELAIEQIRLAGDNTSALLMLDQRFGERQGHDHDH